MGTQKQNGFNQVICKLTDLGFFLSHAVYPRCELNSSEGLCVIGRIVRDVGNHCCSAVDIPKRFPQQHSQLAVPELHIKISSHLKEKAGCQSQSVHSKMECMQLVLDASSFSIFMN